VRLTDFEKVSFHSDSPKMVKEKEVGPPTLIAPANMAPIVASGPHPVGFSWSPVGRVNTFHIRISRNPYFSSTVFDRVVSGTQVQVVGLGEGPYYWLVQTVGPDGRQSAESEKNRLTVIVKAKQASPIVKAKQAPPIVKAKQPPPIALEPRRTSDRAARFSKEDSRMMDVYSPEYRGP